MIELLSDPSIWLGFFALVSLEIILGIDNLVFIAILANKLPPHQRTKARNLGLGLALIMRLGLLFVMSWLVTLTEPVVSYATFNLSIRDLILIVGGFFLLLKATLELHERLEGKLDANNNSKVYAGFAAVVAQIVILDAVFSFDAVITAVGMVEHLEVMMAAVIVAMAVMVLAAKALTDFVGKHPTVVILCLSFLLMIGFSLIVEGLGFHIPKSYLYAAIGFSIVIEAFNQFMQRNRTKHESAIPLRDRTADNILRLMGGKTSNNDEELLAEDETSAPSIPFAEEERYMISGVLALGERDVETIMTPRSEVSWVNVEDDLKEIREQVLSTPHSLLPICQGQLNKILGVVRAKDILAVLDEQPNNIYLALEPLLTKQQPVFVSDTIDNLRLINLLKNAKGNLAIVVDEYGQVAGLVTPLDLFEAIAGEFPDEDETLEIVKQEDHWIAEGTISLDQLRLELNDPSLLGEAEQLTIGGYINFKLDGIAQVNEHVSSDGFIFTVLETLSTRILLVKIERDVAQ
ncbi:probable transport protein, TerC family [Psychrobacter arcticus 273-4]|uniref:Probable transport protein, TerC family n=1 Tax=Psychrobacter arcticus (strain DSM 17307 / VKM B-2377 / 273-4) TaxID=259536 RepID=Q4FV92_PSYA2|nr:TerC family protein [Psychrobacter arcticus]AAZ18066.1 probable transport protein, TerC family [Psychrobacter arcticus 273-4]